MKTALLIIDLQETFVGHHRNTPLMTNTMAYINETAKLFLDREAPVIIIRDLEEGDGPGFENIPELQVKSKEKELTKIYSNSFWQTDLEDRLQALGVEVLVLCGNAAEFCVLATYNGAIERGFKPLILQHGVFARYEEGLLDLYRNRSLISYEALAHFMEEE